MKKKIAFALIFCASIFTSNVLAWGTTGHRVIAELAELNLNSKAKKGIRDLLDNQSLAYWANWGDFVKSDTTALWTHTHVWHYVNAPEGLAKTDFIAAVQSMKHENLYSEIIRLSHVVKDKSQSRSSRKNALVFLIHLVGDMHQPMHVGREEDMGGNKIPVMWFNEKTNLHSLWDSKLIDFEKYSYSEYAKILNVLSVKEKKNMQRDQIVDWLYETHLLAMRIYEMTPPDSKLSYDYNYKTKSIVEMQLQKGGIHLAQLLNKLF